MYFDYMYSLAWQWMYNVQARLELELKPSLKMIFEIKLVKKSKSLSLAWFGLAQLSLIH